MQTPRLARRALFRRAAPFAPVVMAACGLPIVTRRPEPAPSALPPASLEVWFGGQNAEGDLVLALGQSTWQGKLLGLPYKLNAWTYAWRRDLLS